MEWWMYIILWGVVLFITLIIEVNTVDLTSIWFSVASLVSLILAACRVHITWQIGTFVVLSIVLVFATRPLTKKMMNKDIVRTNADKVIQMIGIVTKKIPSGDIGEVRVNSELWRAISLDTNDIEEGEKVVINSLSGNKLLVSKVQKNSNYENL